MALTVKALEALLDEAEPDQLVVIARFDGDEVHADGHIDDGGKVVLREQGREFALVKLAQKAASQIIDDPANATEQGDLRTLRTHIHETIANPEPVKPIRELRVGKFSDDPDPE